MPSHEREVYAFGEFELDLAARTLARSGIPVSLAPKTFDLLAMLVRRPRTLFSKREIIEELWPDTFVEEANLSFQVAALRKALGENAIQWIETVPKHGYRFKAPVRRLTIDLASDSAPAITGGPLDNARQSPPGAATAANHSQWQRILAVAVVAMTLLPVGWLIARRFRRSSPALLVALPFTTYGGSEIDPSISPDGNQLAFAWNGPKQDNLDIYIKVIGEESPLRLTSDPRAECSAEWSPDARHIAFCRDRGEVVIMPAIGGPERVVARPSANWIPDRIGGCVTWFPDGTALAVVAHPVKREANGSTPLQPAAIFGLSLATGHSWPLTFPADRTLGDGAPKISPDGRQLAFLRSNTMEFDQPELFSVPLTSDKLPSGKPIPLGTDVIFGASSGPREWIGTGLAWLSDSRTVVLAQRGRLWAVPTPSGTPTLLPLSGFRPSSLSISRSGRLVFVNESFDMDILRVAGPTNRDVSGKSRSPAPFITSTSPDTNPQYSPDGKRIAFTSTRGGGLQIWVCNSDGSNPVQLTHFVAFAGSPRWSPDGRYIAFDSQEAGGGDIYIVPADGGTARRFTLDDSQEDRPSWSRDGHWIYFTSNRAGQFQLWKAPFPAGKPVRVSQDWGVQAVESMDGKFVYYAKRGRGIWRQPVEGGQEQLVVDHGEPEFWDMYSHGLCLLNLEPNRPRIECLDFTAHVLSTVVTLPDDHRIWDTGPSFTVSPDGQWILYSHVERSDNSIMSVDSIGEVIGH
jgi:Tol biopolymer transport system component/DNA-binding winged helix-turn-helix (wHTH) protein